MQDGNFVEAVREGAKALHNYHMHLDVSRRKRPHHLVEDPFHTAVVKALDEVGDPHAVDGSPGVRLARGADFSKSEAL